MLIDWFTVGAQVLNFAILVWLLKRFLYKPILDAIDARERRIAAAIADADSNKAQALAERDEFRRRNDELQQQAAEFLTRAEQDAQLERQRLLEQARQAADAIGAKRREALRDDADQLNEALRTRVEREVFAIARKALADLAEVSLEERMVEVFVSKLRALSGSDREALVQALHGATEPVIVRSTFELPEALRAAVRGVLEQHFATPPALRFETAPALVSGIELITNGQKVAWNIAAYLASMQAGIAELAAAPARPGSENR